MVDWQAIRRWHTGEHPDSPYKWDDIGYHFGIERIGAGYEILIGRTLDQHGAHTKEMGMNRRGIGICCVGNYDLAPPPDALLAKLVQLVRWLVGQFSVHPANIRGHHSFAPYKSCPGKLFDIDRLREMI